MALFATAARLAGSRLGALMRTSSIGRITLEGARFVFYVGLPYAALLTGAFAPSDVGLQGSPAPGLILGWTPEDWARAIGQAAALAGLSLTVVAVLAWQARRAGGHVAMALSIEPISIAHSIREAVYAEAHWSFYRALPALAAASAASLAMLSEARWAALAGLGLITVEALLAGRYTETGRHRIRLYDALLAATSATFFALTGGNMWVASVLQIVARIGFTMLANAGDQPEALRNRESQDDVIV
jgi:hypothetical protein